MEVEEAGRYTLEFGQRANNLVVDQVDAARARAKLNRPLQPHANDLKATFRMKHRTRMKPGTGPGSPRARRHSERRS